MKATFQTMAWAMATGALLTACGGEGPDPSSRGDDDSTSISQAVYTCTGCSPTTNKCINCTCTPTNLSEDCLATLESRCDSSVPISCSPSPGGQKCSCTLHAPSTSSCFQACGVYSSNRVCQCDAACTTYGDCCPDRAAQCSPSTGKCSCDPFCGINKNCCSKC